MLQTNNNHAYSHWIGRVVGFNLGDGRIVAATVMTPELGQDHNLILVVTDDNAWHEVRGMDTHRSDFINSSL